MRALAVLVALSAVAHADATLDLHAGGGLEGGKIDHGKSPDGVVEVGLAGELLRPGHTYGIGISLETVGRSGRDLSRYEEDKLDLTIRVAPIPSVHVGFGMGLRWMSPEPVDGEPQPTRSGIDFARMDVDATFVHADVNGARLAAGGYFAWTMGCYRDACADSFTLTYVLGLQMSVSTAP